jgi:hypothetical protein
VRLARGTMPVIILVSLGLAGCGTDYTPRRKILPKPFEGAMPTAGSAELTVFIPLR